MSNPIADDPSSKPPMDPCRPGEAGRTTPAKEPPVPVVEQSKINTSLVFHVDSVEKTETPGGGQGHDWHRYVLKNHRSTISGLRRGTRQHVVDYAAQYAEQLNSRILFGSRNWTMRNTKPARTL